MDWTTVNQRTWTWWKCSDWNLCSIRGLTRAIWYLNLFRLNRIANFNESNGITKRMDSNQIADCEIELQKRPNRNLGQIAVRICPPLKSITNGQCDTRPAMPDLRLPPQPQSVTAHWPAPNYIAWWQRHKGANNSHWAATSPRPCHEWNRRPLDRESALRHAWFPPSRNVGS